MITVWDIAKARGVREDESGSVEAGEFERVRLPFFAGCQHCGESLAPYNAYPSRNGFISCDGCIHDTGYATVDDFERDQVGV